MGIAVTLHYYIETRKCLFHLRLTLLLHWGVLTFNMFPLSFLQIMTKL